LAYKKSLIPKLVKPQEVHLMGLSTQFLQLESQGRHLKVVGSEKKASGHRSEQDVVAKTKKWSTAVVFFLQTVHDPFPAPKHSAHLESQAIQRFEVGLP
jgi:hypothetical protein